MRVAALLALALSALPSVARAACDPPRCRELVVRVPRGLRVPDGHVRMLLPAGYDGGHARYPVLYLLHGAGDTFAAWTDRTDVADFTTTIPLIVVMPDGGHDANAGFYSDWIDGSRQWETFHTRVLRKWVDRRFRTLRGARHRAVAGLSMGGFGAMSYAARHRHLFRAAATFSGAVDTLYPSPASPVLYTLHVVGAGLWGDPATHLDTWRDHNPTDRAADLAGVALLLATGDGTTGGPAGDVSDPLAYATEQVVPAMTHDFAGALDAAHVAHVDDFYRGGYHGWPYWQRELHWALPQIMDVIGRRRR